ncbi:unnamed protein product [Meganyctiphanes norvegica]|uniref:SEA domain-containing protein n=1 Tax=Meganyctiphanes norvegica TaxID=48144 RepID=A0AAV2RWS2_MEGNR
MNMATPHAEASQTLPPRGANVKSVASKMHNGRIIGVIGTLSNGGTMYANDHSVFPQNLADLARVQQTNFSQHKQPKYTCEAPQAYEHIYQCPVHHQRDQYDQKIHTEHGQRHIDPGGTLAYREIEIDHKNYTLEKSRYDKKKQTDCQHIPTDNNLNYHLLTRKKPRLDHSVSSDQIIELGNHHVVSKENKLYIRGTELEMQDQLEDQGENGFQDTSLANQTMEHKNYLDSTLDQHSGYHYSSSDYSSTEPIYAQPQLCTGRHCVHTPTNNCNNKIGSLRALGSYGGTPAAFLVRSDSYGHSTLSSTLPTVSAHLTHNYSTHSGPVTTQSIQSLRATVTRLSKRGSSNTPTNHKRKSLFRAWKVKFLQGENCCEKECLLLAALVFLIILVFGIIATVLYLAIAGDLSSLIGSSPRLIEMAETGSNLVEGRFSITNQNFQPAFAERLSSPYRSIVKSIENELDILFSGSVWSREYNHSQVNSLLPLESSVAASGLLVQVQFFLNSEDVAAAQKLGSAFLRGLDNRHGHDWLGPYAINITSIRFSEVLMGTTTMSSTTSSIVPESFESQQDSAFNYQSTPYLNVGWGSWGPWSTCSPCSPQFDQIRTRQCRLNAGHGLLISNIEPCLAQETDAHAGESDGDYDEEIETRPCQCHQHDQDRDVITSTPLTTITTAASSPKSVTDTTTSTTTTIPTAMMMDKNPPGSLYHCKFCSIDKVCVALEGETHPTCREPLDASDPTGCGGLCVMDSEVCQALGSRAFNCHSASQCLHDEWRCDDGLCIPHIKRCDGHMNCYDRSDEQHCGDISSPSSISSTGRWQISGMGQMNPAVALDVAANPTHSNAGVLDLSHHSPFVIGGSRVTVPVMNRTAIGLSSLSHRERELLS